MSGTRIERLKYIKYLLQLLYYTTRVLLPLFHMQGVSELHQACLQKRLYTCRLVAVSRPTQQYQNLTQRSHKMSIEITHSLSENKYSEQRDSKLHKNP